MDAQYTTKHTRRAGRFLCWQRPTRSIPADKRLHLDAGVFSTAARVGCANWVPLSSGWRQEMNGFERSTYRCSERASGRCFSVGGSWGSITNHHRQHNQRQLGRHLPGGGPSLPQPHLPSMWCDLARWRATGHFFIGVGSSSPHASCRDRRRLGDRR